MVNGELGGKDKTQDSTILRNCQSIWRWRASCARLSAFANVTNSHWEVSEW
jgi:hypothetical protein